MAEYIEREAAIKAMEKADCAEIADDAESCKSDYLREVIESVPAADVVPVVRCKDCKYAQNDYDGFSTTVGCNMLKCATGWHSFCSYGERRDGGAENEI